MSETEEAAPVAPEPSTPAPEDNGLPLALFERNLAPIRRVAAYATQNPSQSRFIEANTRRWLDPLLEADVPGPIRDVLVTLAGQLAGVDHVDADSRLARLRQVRQELARLDAVLGLPLPRADRPRLRRARVPRAKAPAQESSEEPAPRERRGRRNRNRGRSREREDRPADEPAAKPAPRGTRSTRRRSFWGGNPFVELAALDIPSELIDALAAANLHTVSDLLHRVPVREEVLTPIHGAGRSIDRGRVAVGGRFSGASTRLFPDGRHAITGTLLGADRLTLTWTSPEAADRFLCDTDVGSRVVVVGEWNGDVLLDPVRVVEDGKSVRLVEYGIQGVADDLIQSLLFRLLPGFSELRDPLPATVRLSGLVSHSDALLALHARGDEEKARRRLAYEEALGLTLASCWPASTQRKRGIQQSLLHRAPSVILSNLDTTLSDPAEMAFDAIRRDLRKGRPMRRLLAGRPGGGKGLIALLCAAAVAENKVQVLWLAPTAQRAEALHAFSAPLFEMAGQRAEYLRPGKKPSNTLRDQLKRGEVSVLFTTPEALAHTLDYRRLGLVISVEGDAESVVQEQVGSMNSPHPDLLVVASGTATSDDLLGRWSQFSVCWVDGPATPTPVVKTVSQRDSGYAAARHALNQGGQVAVLFPQIKGQDALDPTEASRVMTAIGTEVLSGARMTLLHGAMPAADRVQTVSDLSHRRADALVATVPLEDLPPIPGLEVVIVEHAQRVDPARLARIAGMGVHQVSLIVGDDTAPGVIESLVEALAGQKPTMALDHLSFFDGARDLDLLLEARSAALDILSTDGSLRNGANADLVRLVRGRWSAWFGEEPCPLPDVGEGSLAKRRRRRRRRR